MQQWLTARRSPTLAKLERDRVSESEREGRGKVKVELPQLRTVIFLIKTKTAMHSRRWPRGVAATAWARIGVGVGGAGAGGLQPERDIVYENIVRSSANAQRSAVSII